MPRITRRTFRNDNEMYSNVLKRRGVKSLEQYTTANYKNLTELMANNGVTFSRYVWTAGDKFYNLSYRFFNGDPKCWWLIPLVNGRFTESDYQPGEIILIPQPKELALSILGGR